MNKCKQCNYVWEGRKRFPKQCPRCKRYDWDRKNAHIVRGEENK